MSPVLWLRRSRVLRLLLACLFAPLVIVTQTGAAEAVSAAGVTIKLDQKSGPFNMGDDPSCRIVVEVIGGDVQIQTGVCDVTTTPDMTCEVLDPSCTFMDVKFVGDNGCQRQGALSLAGYVDQYFSNSVRVSSDRISAGGCPPVRVCIGMKFEASFARDSQYDGCATFPLPPPEDSPQCEHATGLTRPVRQAPELMESGGYTVPRYQWFQRVRVEHSLTPGLWGMYVLSDGNQTFEAYSGVGTKTMPRAATAPVKRDDPMRVSFYEFTVPEAGPFPPVTEVIIPLSARGNSGMGLAVPNPGVTDVLGVGFYRMPTSGGSASSSRDQRLTFPTAHWSSRLAVTEANQCAFYWGQKLWDDGEQGGRDEPAGPLDPPQGPDGPPPTIPDADPDQPWWVDVVLAIIEAIAKVVQALVAGFASVVDAIAALARDLLSALRDLVSAVRDVVGNILSGIADLFIPSGDPFSGFVDDVSEDMADTAAGEWMTAFSGVFATGAGGAPVGPAGGGWQGTPGVGATASDAPSAAPAFGGGCEGPTINVDAMIPDGVPLGSDVRRIQPFKACEGITADMAYWSRWILGIAIAVFGAFKIFEQIAGAAVGFRNARILKDHDWSHRFAQAGD